MPRLDRITHRGQEYTRRFLAGIQDPEMLVRLIENDIGGAGAVDAMFTWEYSPQGHVYWSRVHQRMQDTGLGLTTLEKYHLLGILEAMLILQELEEHAPDDTADVTADGEDS